MTNPYSRISSLVKNVELLGSLMGGYLPALSYILKTRGKSNAEAFGKYKGIEFKFRRCDISAVREVFLKGEYAFLREIILNKDSPYIYDIGGHIGLFSIWAFSINSQANIHSIEASPQTYKILCSNVEHSKKMDLLWNIENRAAWGNNDTISFSDSSESSMSHRVDDHGKANVKGITLNDIIEKLPNDQNIDLMKIDIEGAEEAFLCADNANFERIDNLVIELHPQLCDIDKVRNVLLNSFSTIEECHDKSLSKPLLYCRK